MIRLNNFHSYYTGFTELKRSLYSFFSQYGRILDIVALKMVKLRGQTWLDFSEVTTASIPRVNTPPPLSSRPVTRNEGGLIVAPKPLRIPPNLVNPLDDPFQSWTRSPTKSKNGTYPSSRDSLQLAPMPDSYNLDRGLLLSIQAIQDLLENKGHPVIMGIVALCLCDCSNLFYWMLKEFAIPNYATLANILPVCAGLEEDVVHRFEKEIHSYAMLIGVAVDPQKALH
ncbi:hypothetical protein AgCh_022920 [Apium graveolens]